MCGRFILTTDLSVIVEQFHIGEVDCDHKPDDNIAPGRQIAAVVRSGVNRLVGFRWGLIPSWARDPAVGNRMFNARAETLSEKPSFREAFRQRRCLVVADGFYEWQRSGRRGKPLRFTLKSGRPFGFAGLYETWMGPEKAPVHTCTIITTTPNELMRPIHDRMPVIVEKGAEAFWMDPGSNGHPKELRALLKPYPAEEMAVAEAFLPGAKAADQGDDGCSNLF